ITQFIEANGRLQRPAGCSSSVYEIMLWCWTHEPHDRPSFRDLLKFLANRSEFSKAVRHFQSLSNY
ncbi:unnamed protein product, partial [Rotaria sp. Silwood1]